MCEILPPIPATMPHINFEDADGSLFLETTDGLHAVHDSEHEDRTGVLRETKLKDSGTHRPPISEEEQAEGQIIDMGELVSLTGWGKGAGLSNFSFADILAATDNFSERNLVGISGFGDVYKGKLSSGVDIAVKRHDASSFEGPNEFRTEIEVIPNLRHKSIIVLLGCCVQGGEKILVYEYMPNKSLAVVIADETKRELLNWSKRLQIIKAIADGLAYLHRHSQMCIVHRDINPSNILLDHEMNAKISDFGLAIKLYPDTTAEVVVCGTYGYADPEYVATGNISEKADVYSFGILLLEVISGKLFRSYQMEAKGTSLGLLFPDYARKYQNKLHKLIDPLLHATKHDRAQIKQCVKVGLRCIHNCSKERPTMSEVVAMLCRIMVVRE